jgi:murein DD-endopeptidase MepM/ murein hydrolase activator NlpD
VGVLSELVRTRAVAAYTSRDTVDLGAKLGLDKPMDAARRTKFLDRANNNDDRIIRQLDAARDDLALQQADIERRRVEQQRLNKLLSEEFSAARSAVEAANQARDELAARLEREQAAAAQAEAARIRAEQAARQASLAIAAAVAAPASGGSGGQAGVIIANPGGGSFQCPVQGSSYSAGSGPRGGGFLYGIDMFASTGTPTVAVKSGFVSHMAMNGGGGNEAYLAADDGNVYFYAHLAQFVGGPRQVSQGEVIGTVGSTGNASGPHLHFEIRIGGPNGQRVDPYPTLQSAGC